MHERSVAEDLVRAAGVNAIDEGGSVAVMRVQVGSLSCIDPDALHDQVVWWSQGTIVEGANILIEVVPADLEDEHGAEVKLVSIEVGA
jgi:Zn finger protein HypA/HybF involved in hydrogenase expression